MAVAICSALAGSAWAEQYGPIGGRIGGPIGHDPRYDPVAPDPRYDPLSRGRSVLPQAEVTEGQTVRGRPRPDYDAIGQYIDSFLLFPTLDVTETFTDNLLLEEEGEEADFVTNVEPAVRLQSDWGRHGLALNAGANIGQHVFNPNENYEDYAAGFGGRLDIYGASYMTADIGFQHLHESRSSPDDVGGAEPTEFDVYSAGLLGFIPSGRFSFTLTGDVDRFDFDDVEAGRPGLPLIDNDDRDRIDYLAALRAAYEIQPRYQAYVRVGADIRQYDQAADNEGFDRDSHGFDAVGGVEIDFTGLLFGDFFIGYDRREYEDPALDAVQGVNGGADLTWNVTPLTTLNLLLRSSVEETTEAGASGYQAYRAGLSVDHELLRNLILTANAGATLADYQGIDRTYYDARAGVSATYFLNRFVHGSAGYRYSSRFSDDPTLEEFDENVVFLSLGLQY